MSLPIPAPRRKIHTRKTSFEGFLRDDGLWEIEAELIDTKPHPFDSHGRGRMPPEQPIHHMKLRITIDGTLTITDIASEMVGIPYDECTLAQDPIRSMIGVKMGPGWRKAIDARLGGTKSCTHLRELLFNAATAAYQSVPSYAEHLRRERGEAPPTDGPMPFHLGQCMTWAFDGAAALRYYPKYAGYQPPARTPK